MSKCKRCDGAGKVVMDEVNCHECGGSGEVADPVARVKPTLDDLRKLAEAAKRRAMFHACEAKDDTGCRCTEDERGCTCEPCLGAKRAAEDVGRHIENAMSWIVFTPQDGNDNENVTRSRAASFSDAAAVIESYFGAPGVVARFADAVREFCS